MRRHLVNLSRNLLAGLRLALFLPVSRLAFRIDLAQLLLLLVISALIDVGVDWVRVGNDGYFSWLGLGNEFFGAGVLLVASAVLAVAFRDYALALALPVLVLAGFPLLQLARALPDAAAPWLPASTWRPFVIEVVLVTWVVALSARAVLIAIESAPRRWWRAIVGAIVLVAPIWFAPAFAPSDTWWKSPSATTFDPRYPNPAAEPVLAAQSQLLDDALSNLDDERPGITDLYFVGFAGDAHEDVFRKDVLAAQKVMDERWGTEGRSIVLINNPRTLLETPVATITNLRETLNEIGATIDKDQDVVMVYLASHGSRDHVLEVALPPLELAPITAPALKGLFEAAGIKWRIVVVSACYSGAFIDALKDDYTMVVTASASERASFGCGHQSEATFFGEAFFQQGLAHSDSLAEAFEAARTRVAEREKEGGFKPPSEPQSYVGSAMGEKLKELDRRNAKERSGRGA
jgi:peptidase C13-like protein